jgi:hypothetical protein
VKLHQNQRILAILHRAELMDNVELSTAQQFVLIPNVLSIKIALGIRHATLKNVEILVEMLVV